MKPGVPTFEARSPGSGVPVPTGSQVMISCHRLPYVIDSGPANMALDEALLEEVAERGEPAYLRTYGWSRPTLSLGYFQKLAEAEAEPRRSRVPLVRRATGGGAIWHQHELTYALVLPSHHPLARPHTALYRVVHSAIAGSLCRQGVEARRRGGPDHAEALERSRVRPFLCFTDRDPEDIVNGGSKVVGSAQRRRMGAILQHGSILMRHSDRTPELAGICDLAGVGDDPGFWSDRILGPISQALGLTLVPQEPPAAVLRRASELERTVYRDAAWTGRR
jgi:lipoate-protein ligase A